MDKGIKEINNARTMKREKSLNKRNLIASFDTNPLRLHTLKQTSWSIVKRYSLMYYAFHRTNRECTNNGKAELQVSAVLYVSHPTSRGITMKQYIMSSIKPMTVVLQFSNHMYHKMCQILSDGFTAGQGEAVNLERKTDSD